MWTRPSDRAPSCGACGQALEKLTLPHRLPTLAQNFLENEWPGERPPEMFYDPCSLAASETTRSALHAKCIVVDGRKALVTSANFTEAAQERNIELGLLVYSEAAATQIEQHFRRLIERNHLRKLPIAETPSPSAR